MNNKEFGLRIRQLRQEKNISREEFCGDETELSVRQLSRIELGDSAPTLTKVSYIAKRLGVSIGQLTDVERLELPKRYKELKYQILRTSTYLDEERLQQRENQFDEIFSDYYENLPEEEQLMVDCIQASMDVALSQNINFGIGLLNDYFEQVKLKERYSENDLILIELYFMCLVVSDFDKTLYDSTFYKSLMKNLLDQERYTEVENLFLVNKILIKSFSVAVKLENYDILEEIAETSRRIMTITGDFQKMPLLNLIEWKYSLFVCSDRAKAQEYFDSAISFSRIVNDKYLENNLQAEWEKDTSRK